EISSLTALVASQTLFRSRASLQARRRSSNVSRMDRRAFLAGGAAGAVSWLAGSRRVRAQAPVAAPAQAPAAEPDVPYGETPLKLDRKSTRLNSSHGSISY